MAQFHALFSGSAGNCAYIGARGTGILIDAGVSASRIRAAMLDRGLDIAGVRGLFITHEHTDHVAGVRVLAYRQHIPVYMTAGTLRALARKDPWFSADTVHILPECMTCGELQITRFATSHDCEDSCGYIIDTGGVKMAVCTDLGVVSDTVRKSLLGCDLVMLESNHDIGLLQSNPAYPLPLKRRILGDAGHLSNNACAGELAGLVQSGATRLVLAHLSRHNNIPALAHKTAVARLALAGMQDGRDYLLQVATPNGANPVSF